LPFDAILTPTPLGCTGNFTLSTEQLLAAFRDVLKPGHEDDLQVAIKLLLLWSTLDEADRAQVIADVFALVRKATGATEVHASATLEPRGAPA
jgi:hypothetical protein